MVIKMRKISLIQTRDRILEMVTDEDENVRDQVVHSLCDGAPKSRETEVIESRIASNN